MGLDYYEILSLQRTATTADVQKAYRKLALKHHPDRSANEESIAVFSLISEAYDVLCNPKTKGFYDLYGEEGIKYGVTDGKGTKKGGFYATKKTPLETFVEFFGTENPFAALEDLSKSLQSVLGTPVLKPGKKKTIPFHWRSPWRTSTRGAPKSSRTRGRFFTTTASSRPRPRNSASPSAPAASPERSTSLTAPDTRFPGARPAQLFTSLRRRPTPSLSATHPVFERDGADLIFKVQIPLVKSLAGFSIDLQTLDKRTLCIPVTDIVQTGDTMVIDGEGLPTGGGTKGNIVVIFEVLFPKVLSETQKQLIRSGFYLPSSQTAAQQKSVDTYLGSFQHSTEGWSVGFQK